MKSSAVWKRRRKLSDNLDQAMQAVVNTTRAVSGAVRLAVGRMRECDRWRCDLTWIVKPNLIMSTSAGSSLIADNHVVTAACRLTNQSFSIRLWHHLGKNVTLKHRAVSMIRVTFQIMPASSVIDWFFQEGVLGSMASSTSLGTWLSITKASQPLG